MRRGEISREIERKSSRQRQRERHVKEGRNKRPREESRRRGGGYVLHEKEGNVRGRHKQEKEVMQRVRKRRRDIKTERKRKGLPTRSEGEGLCACRGYMRTSVWIRVRR